MKNYTTPIALFLLVAFGALALLDKGNPIFHFGTRVDYYTQTDSVDTVADEAFFDLSDRCAALLHDDREDVEDRLEHPQLRNGHIRWQYVCETRSKSLPKPIKYIAHRYSATLVDYDDNRFCKDAGYTEGAFYSGESLNEDSPNKRIHCAVPHVIGSEVIDTPNDYFYAACTRDTEIEHHSIIGCFLRWDGHHHMLTPIDVENRLDNAWSNGHLGQIDNQYRYRASRLCARGWAACNCPNTPYTVTVGEPEDPEQQKDCPALSSADQVFILTKRLQIAEFVLKYGQSIGRMYPDNAASTALFIKDYLRFNGGTAPGVTI